MFVGGMVGIGALINYVDFSLFLIILFNMVGVYLCHGEVKELTEEYFADSEKWEKQKWVPEGTVTGAEQKNGSKPAVLAENNIS